MGGWIWTYVPRQASRNGKPGVAAAGFISGRPIGVEYITQKSSPWHYKIPTVGRDIIEGRPIALGKLRYDAIEDLHPLHQDKMASECLVDSRRLITITGIIIDSKFCKLIPP